MMNKFSGRLLSQVTRTKSLFRVSQTSFSNSLKDKETAEEKIFIDKHERELMKKLLSKLEAKGEIDQHHHDTNPDSDKLAHILKRHHKQISNELFADLISWKKGQL